jgi:hypothetical protein
MPLVRLVDGFLEDRGEWIWSPSADYRGDRQVIERSTGKVVIPRYRSRFLNSYFWNQSPDDLYVPYFKIHGSFDWAYTQSVIARVDREYWLWDKESLSFYHRLRDMVWPDPPSFKPYIWEPGNKEWFTNAYQQVAYEFLNIALQKAKAFIFAGYSFRDEHLLNCLREANQINHSLRTIAIDPSGIFIPELLASIDVSRFTHLKIPLSDAAPYIERALAGI